MKKLKVSTGIRIDAITPHITYVTYQDGSHEFIRDAITLEDLANMERQDEWMRAQLMRNKLGE